jgi:putative ABC transport system ATP-binding protein
MAIIVENLVKLREFPGEDNKLIMKKTLDSVSFSAEKGKILAIMGPSGGGKTTVLRILNRLEDPDEGTVSFYGTDIRTIPIIELRRKIGLVMQTPCMFEGTVLDNLLFGPRLAGADLKVKTEEITELLPWFGFESSFLQRDPEKLSVGEKQRVNILRTLANTPEVLLLDEPTASLDPVSSGKLLDIVKIINQKRNMTIIMVTHIPDHAGKIADKVLIMADGKVVEQGEAPAVLKNPTTSVARDFLEGKV